MTFLSHGIIVMVKQGDVIQRKRDKEGSYEYLYSVLEVQGTTILVLRMVFSETKLIVTDLATFSQSSHRERWIRVGWNFL